MDLDMEQSQFIKTLIEEVKEIPIEDVIGSYTQLNKKGKYYMGLCPFHADKNVGSFVVTPSKNVWNCFACPSDISGNGGISFIMKIHNINFLEAVFKLGLEYQKITLDEYEHYFKKKRYRREYICKLQTRYLESKKVFSGNKKATDNILDKVYRIFKSCCTLSQNHYKHLKEKRKLSENHIKEDYFTFPNRKIYGKFISKLREHGMDEEILKSIPGFYYDIKQGKTTFVTFKGIGILIKNSLGQAIAIQVRLDESFSGMRYLWFSSSSKDDETKYKDYTGSGSPCDVMYPKEINNPVIAITEGRFKAEKLAEKGLISISVQGVGSWRGIVKEIKKIQQKPEYKKIAYNYIKYKKSINADFNIPIYVCFDADMIPNNQVYQQAQNMTDSLLMLLNGYKCFYINWEEEYGKGIDDLINNGKMNKVKKYTKENMDTTHNKIIELIKENEVPNNYENINKVPKEIMEAYFKENMFKTLKAI